MLRCAYRAIFMTDRGHETLLPYQQLSPSP
jgi:hypothetical protein